MILAQGTGIPNYITNLYRECLALDTANSYVFFQPQLNRTIGRTEVAFAPPGSLGAAWFDLFGVESLIRRAKLNLFHGPSHILPWRKSPGVQYVVTIHDLANRVVPNHYRALLRWYYRWRLPVSLSLADAIIAVSRNTKQDLMKWYKVPESKIHVIHLGVPAHLQQAQTVIEKSLCSGKYFFSVTTHPKRKNILGAMHAFARFAKGINLSYIIAGVIEAAQRRELLTLAEKLGIKNQIVLFGYASNEQLTNLYRNAEFLIYPSFYEGFGFPVVEAMSSGCPVIASNNSSLPELLPDNLWLVDPYQPADMADKMLKMLALSPEHRQTLISTNKAYVQRFTWRNAARQTIEVFSKLRRS